MKVLIAVVFAVAIWEFLSSVAPRCVARRKFRRACRRLRRASDSAFDRESERRREHEA